MDINKKVLIAEDDPFTARIVEQMLKSNFPEYIVTGKTKSVKDSLTNIKLNSPNLVILDIQLEDGTAFELLQQVELFDFKIIFMSANHSWVEKSMQFAAVNFLFKPFDENDFVVALEKTMETYKDDSYKQCLDVMLSNIKSNPNDWKLVLSKDNEPIAVSIKDIVYGESVSGGSNFKIDNNEVHKISKPLRRYETLLSPYAFFRCHPRYVVNIRKIAKIDSDSLEIELFTGEKIPYEKWRQDNLMKLYIEYRMRLFL